MFIKIIIFLPFITDNFTILLVLQRGEGTLLTPTAPLYWDDILLGSASHPPVLFGETKVGPWGCVPQITFIAWV